MDFYPAFLLMLIAQNLNFGIGGIPINTTVENKHVFLSGADKLKLEKMKKYIMNNNIQNPDGPYTVDKTLREQEPVNPKEIGGVVLQVEAERIGYKLHQMSYKEMGVTKMQRILDGLEYKEVKSNYAERLNQSVENLQNKFKSHMNVLNTNRIFVENLYKFHMKKPISHVYECCNVPKSELRYDEHYHCRVTRSTTCDLIPPSAPPTAFNPGRNLTDVFQHISKKYIKWQYFISSTGIHTEFPAHSFGDVSFAECKNKHDVRHRSVYVSTIYPARKNIVIVLDHGNSLSQSQYDTAKAIAQHILSSLSQNDMVNVIGLSSQALFARYDGCLSSQLCPMTVEAQLYLADFIQNLHQHSSSTNHSLGFEEAFNVIWNSLNPDNKTMSDEKAMILYISRGLLSSLTEAKDVLKIIARENGRLRHSVVINTYAVVEEGKPIMYEKTFLQNIATQNFTKYLVEATYPGPVMTGTMVSVSSTRDLSSVVGNFSESLKWAPSHLPQIFLPIKDSVGEGLVVPVTWPCFDNTTLIGMVGLDIHLADIAEDVTYFTEEKNAYAFLINDKGQTVMHPDLERPLLSRSQPVHIDINYLEQVPGFPEVKHQIVSQPTGSRELLVTTKPLSYTHSKYRQIPEDSIIKITYIWKHVYVKKLNMAPYIFVIKVVDDGSVLREFQSDVVGNVENIAHHRIDLLLPAQHVCMHLKQLATLDKSTLYLSASCFLKPFDHLMNEETKRNAQNYVTYLNDRTEYISNTPVGLRPDIKKDITAMSMINSHWIGQAQNSEMRDYVVRRYIASVMGSLYMYPGTLMNNMYNPVKRNWFTRAMEFPGQVTLTAPYLDSGGAGYVVTLSHTIFEGRDDNNHGSNDRVMAVMGMDITLGYFYKLLIEQISVCEWPHIRCFLMDDRGYLIAHPGLMDPNGKGPVEDRHITHKEPLVANDILGHIGFVQKNLCNSYNDRTIQRFYQFNTSVETVLTNLVHGEQCSRYQVSHIPGTNMFLGVVNQTCDMMKAFCPCSVIDRLCLNCKRMEQTECECPCECPLDMNFCTGDLFFDSDRNPNCPPAEEEVGIERVSEEALQKLPQCYNPRCESRGHKMECLGVVDCEWCVVDTDGLTPLDKPFCSTQRTCFAGVLGAPTPYDDGKKVETAVDKPEITTVKSTPVGPVAGGIMACFLVIALALYCYRHRVHRNSHHYMTAAPDSQYRMGFEEQIEDLDPENDPNGAPGGHTNIILATFDSPSVSPYRVNANYRRPGTHTESDLGYSTMTPQDDSEQASTCAVEPVLIGRQRYRPSAQAAASLSKPMTDTPIIPPPPPSSRRSLTPPPLVNLSPNKEHPAQANPGQFTMTGVPGQTVLPGQQGGGNQTVTSSMVDSQTVLTTESPNVVLVPVQVHMVDTH